VGAGDSAGHGDCAAILANLEHRSAIWQTDTSGFCGLVLSGVLRRISRMALTPDEVAKVALLARLRLRPDELGPFTSQLNSIVDYVAQLQSLDTSNVEPLAHGVELRNVFREDRVEPSLPREAALQNAPKRNDHSFLVPAVLE
jgi:aspartyl-tRNA(Asn)/glutamyl-tRNA(Gln) amidotransferase subunit C